MSLFSSCAGGFVSASGLLHVESCGYPVSRTALLFTATSYSPLSSPLLRGTSPKSGPVLVTSASSLSGTCSRSALLPLGSLLFLGPPAYAPRALGAALLQRASGCFASAGSGAFLAVLLHRVLRWPRLCLWSDRSPFGICVAVPSSHPLTPSL